MIGIRGILILLWVPLLLTMHVQSKSCGRSERAASSPVNVNKAVQPIDKTSENRAEQPPVSENVVNNSNNKTKDSVKQREVPHGVWGGQHIRLEVRADGADIEYDCAHGTIVGKLRLDAQGRFNLTGTHAVDRPGPVRVGEAQKGRPARYSGEVSSNEMSLTVTLTDANEEIGSFNLTRGSEGRLRKCR